MHLKTIILGALGLPLCGAFASPETPDFETEVRPILDRDRVRCHNAEKTKGGLRMDAHELILEGGDTEDALVSGYATASEILVRIQLRPIDEGVMPDEGRAREPSEVAILDAWVKAGAPWPEGVTLTERKPDPIKRVSLPENPPESPIETAARSLSRNFSNIPASLTAEPFSLQICFAPVPISPVATSS